MATLNSTIKSSPTFSATVTTPFGQSYLTIEQDTAVEGLKRDGFTVKLNGTHLHREIQLPKVQFNGCLCIRSHSRNSGLITRTMLEVFPSVPLWRNNFAPEHEAIALMGHVDTPSDQQNVDIP